MKRLLSSLPLAFLLATCGGEEIAAPSDSESAPEEGLVSGAGQIERMNADAAALMASAEVDAEVMTVHHVLIAFGGKVPGATRTQEEAEALAADVYARILAGEDFDTLMRELSDDSGGGVYGMGLKRPPPGGLRRRDMVTGFGDVSWHLEVGDVGVTLFSPETSPYGWHIVKRVE